LPVARASSTGPLCVSFVLKLGGLPAASGRIFGLDLDPRCELKMKPTITSTTQMIKRKNVDVPTCGTRRNSTSMAMNNTIVSV